ncbi:MAG: two-component regulator propeller domain-containing protein [Bacteroidota bacterium]
MRARRTQLRWPLAALLAVAAGGCGAPGDDPTASGTAAQAAEATSGPARAERTAEASRLAPRFETLTIADGLVSNEVNVFHQDRRGFLWVGTFGGLSRFDGASFVTHLHDPTDSTSLAHNYVNSLYEGPDGSLWVGTNGGLDRFDPATETFTHFRHDPEDPATLGSAVVRAVLVTDDGTVWAGTWDGGLNRIDPESGTVTRIRSGPDATHPAPSIVHVLATGDDGALWTGGSSGLSHYDPATDTFTHILRDPADSASPLLPTVTALHRDRAGQVWAGTRSEGLFRFDPQSQEMAHYPSDPERPGAIGNPWVLSLVEDHDGAIWAGTNGAGLHRYDSRTDAFDRFTFDPSDPQSIRDDNVLNLLVTRDGVLWVGTYGGLARRYPLSQVVAREAVRPGDATSLSSNDVTAFAEGPDGVVWVGTSGGGLNRRDPAAGSFSHVVVDPSAPSTLGSERVFDVAVDAGGAVWASTYAGLYRGEPGGRPFERFLAPEDEAGIGVIFPLAEANGDVWGGGTGVLAIDAATMRTDRYPLSSRFERVSIDARELLLDPEGDVWVGTYEGLFRLDPEARAWARVPLDPEEERFNSRPEITGLARTASGAVWVGTGDGLYRLEGEGPEISRIHRSDGLPNTDVTDLAIDRLGRLWVLTVAGLSIRDPATGRFVSYGPADGLGGGQALYRSLRSERMYVGTPRGYRVVDPATLGAERPLPTPVLTGIRVDGEAVRTGVERALPDRALATADPIRMRPGSRVVTFGFAALDFRAPGTHRYAVRLDGFDPAWRDLGAQREATFTNLDIGRYTFRVRAAGRHGEWSEETAIALTVLPPWWQTWWAYALYALALGALAAAVVRDRQRRTELRHRLEMERLEAETLRDLDRAKSQFFANVSHEFRTPLTLTLGPLDDVLAGEYGPVPEEATEPIGLARRSAGRVLDLINQILDVSRLEAGHTPLRARRLDLGAFVHTQAEAFVPLAAHRQIALEVDAPEAPLWVWADPGHLGVVLANLLSNAFKFTPGGGTVAVEVGDRDSGAQVVVRDTGPGIAAADLPHIFDRFYQAEGGAGQPLGSGIGLALAYELARLHGGTLSVESEVGEGSAFTLALSLGRDHLTPEQVDDQPWEGAVAAPRHEPDEEPTPLAVAPTETADEDVTTVLVADDQADIRAFVRRHLESAGYRVVEAADGEDALDRVRQRLPDLVVSDVMMPRLDGLGLCRALRSDPETDFLPVLLLTAKAGPEDRLDGLAELCDEYLTKPFDVRELVARIDNLIALRRRLRDRFAGMGGDGAVGEPPIESADDAFVASVRAAIGAGLPDDTFTVGALAEAVGMSRSHLLRKTTDLLDATPSDLIRTARLDRAAELLAARAGTVSEVAYGVGFKSVAHFSNAFLAHTGSRPSAYLEAAE